MKRTDLEKNKGLKIRGQMQAALVPGRFGAAATALPDRREQRKLDQAAGLVPFAVKLHEDLVSSLRERAVQEGVGLNELTARLIQAGLAVESVVDAPAAPKPKARSTKAKSADPESSEAQTSEAKKPAVKAAKAKSK